MILLRCYDFVKILLRVYKFVIDLFRFLGCVKILIGIHVFILMLLRFHKLLRFDYKFVMVLLRLYLEFIVSLSFSNDFMILFRFL